MAGHQMGWCRACTVAMLCRAAPATLSPTHSSGRRIWFATVHNCSVHNAAPFPVHLDLDGTPARRYLPVLPWWRRQLMGPLRRIAVPCVVSSRTPRRYTRHAEPLACPATNANSRILGYRQSSSKIDKPCLRMVDKLCLHVSAAACNFRS